MSSECVQRSLALAKSAGLLAAARDWCPAAVGPRRQPTGRLGFVLLVEQLRLPEEEVLLVVRVRRTLAPPPSLPLCSCPSLEASLIADPETAQEGRPVRRLWRVLLEQRRGGRPRLAEPELRSAGRLPELAQLARGPSRQSRHWCGNRRRRSRLLWLRRPAVSPLHSRASSLWARQEYEPQHVQYVRSPRLRPWPWVASSSVCSRGS